LAKPRKLLAKILRALKKKSLTSGQLCKVIKTSRKVIRQNLSIAEQEGWIRYDALKRANLTLLGKSMIGSVQRPIDAVSFNVDTQIIDYLLSRSDYPKAKCTLISKDAKKILKRDVDTAYDDFLQSKDGLGLPTNATSIEKALAGVVDAILDVRAKELGLASILNLEHRNKLTVENMPTYFPGYDVQRRYVSLADIGFKVLIEYEGDKWVKKQSFKDLAEWYADNFLTYKKSKEEFHSKKREERLEMAIQSIMTGVGIDYRGLKEIEKGRFFNSKEELKRYMIKELEFSVPEDKGDRANHLVEKLEETGVFEYHTKTYHYLKVNKKKFQEVLDYAKEKYSSL
jgi:hypothetical protein